MANYMLLSLKLPLYIKAIWDSKLEKPETNNIMYLSDQLLG